MHAKTPAVVALAGTALALPAAKPPSTALQAPVAGHLTVAAQMRAARDAQQRKRLSARAKRLARRHGARFRARVHRDAPRTPGYLQAIAACESGSNPAANTGNGFYGKYQFTQSTWESVGGTGNPAAAPEAEQDRRAAALYAQAGSSPWPVCGG
jgi:hypothetical protein